MNKNIKHSIMAALVVSIIPAAFAASWPCISQKNQCYVDASSKLLKCDASWFTPYSVCDHSYDTATTECETSFDNCE